MGLINREMSNGAPPQKVPAGVPPGADDESQEDPQEESTESPDAEKQEDAQEPDEQGAQDGSSDPNYQAAMKLAMEVLYKQGAARDVAKSLASGHDPVETLANTAYEMVTVIDEKTNGSVPDELLVSLATQILSEVAEIGEAAGLKIDGDTIAQAMQQMLIRYLTEHGVDPSQLQQAMGQVDTKEVGSALDKWAGENETKETR